MVGHGASQKTEDLGDGFRHHGVCTPVSNHRGTVATVDADGKNVVLVWLFDHRGGYALLLIDALSGKSEEFPVPFPPGGDCPYASILSSRNRFYTHFNSHFVEFDPLKREFTFFHRTVPQMAMGMTEDDQGRIWSVTYPGSGAASYDPGTGIFKDYGHVHKENWAQYQRYVATDDSGWVYFGLGNTASQIIVLDPKTGQAVPVLPEEERGKGNAYVYRDQNGKVYGQSLRSDDLPWYELYRGEWKKMGEAEKPKMDSKPIITSHQGLFHGLFPDGSSLESCDLVERILVVKGPGPEEERTQLSFDYSSEGAHVMGVATAPNGTICGGTAFPMRFFSYDPDMDAWINRASYGQWNTVAKQGDRFFVGGYGGGFLLEWDPSREWVPTEKNKDGCNPLYLTECAPDINRPHALLAHPDGKTLVLAGTPGYGYTGGGLLFWDRQTGERVLLSHAQVLAEHSTHALLALPGGKLLGGTTTSAGTGGEKKADVAELFILDMETKELDWHEALLPEVQGYTDLWLAPKGKVYGFADRRHFFVFDPAVRKIVYSKNTEPEFGLTTSQQGPRVFVEGQDGTVYILFVRGIARMEDAYEISMMAKSPVPIGPGGDFLKGRIYFASGSHLYSYEIP